jgi:O-succinylbenzoic acid--CoA ligase
MDRAGHLPLPLPRMALARPDHPALIVRGREIGYGTLQVLADGLARQLAGLGLGAGDRVALLLPSGLRFVAMLHAAARLEAVLVPLNSRLSEAELGWQIEHSQPKLVVVECAWRERVQEGRARVVELPMPEEQWAEALGSREALAGEASGLSGWLELSEEGAQPPLPLRDRVGLESLQAIVYTSGTTGRPKGAMLSYGNQLWSALGSSLRLGVDPDDRWLAPLPLFHVGGMAVLWRCALAGGTVILPGEPFEAEAIAASLERDRVSMVSLVPTMLGRLLEVWGERPAPDSLRALLLGGGPISSDLLARALALGFPVAPTYGLSEAASQVATARPLRGPPLAGVAAEPLPFTELRIVDELGQELPSPRSGEILVRAPSVMAGYWRDPEASAQALAGGWLHTGDLGCLDERGHLRVGGRRDDLIVSGGENVYPAEIEAALLQHPAVAECCVLGEPDPEWGERVVALLVPTSQPPDSISALGPSSPLPAELDRYLRGLLAAYKLPRRYLLAPSLPRTAAGKIRRAALRGQIGPAGAR